MRICRSWSGPVVTFCIRRKEQLHGFLRNFPNRFVAAVLRILIFPRGRMYSAPSDELGQQVVDLITHPTEARDRLCAGIYSTSEPGNPLGLLQDALVPRKPPRRSKPSCARPPGPVSSRTASP